MSDLMRELVRFADKRGLMGTVPREQRTYSEATGSFHSPTDDKVDSLNALTGDLTVAAGDSITVTVAGQTITIALSDVLSGTFGTHLLGHDNPHYTAHTISFYEDNTPANQTDVVLSRGMGAVEQYVMPRAGSLRAIGLYSNEARTAGTLMVEVTKNGSKTGLFAQLGSATTQTQTEEAGGYYFMPTPMFFPPEQSGDTERNLLEFDAGDLIGVVVTTDAAWAPNSADITVEVAVEY